MFGLTDRHYFLLAVLFYGLSLVYAVFLWRKGLRRDDRVCFFLVLAGAGFQVIAMGVRGVSFARCPVNNLFEATMFVGWTVAAASLAIGWVPRFGFLPVVASPLLFGLGIFGLMPQLDRPGVAGEFWTAFTSLHASVTLLAYGALGLAAVAAAMFLAQEHDLKHRKLRAFAAFLPPIQRLEKVSWRLLLTGFGLFTTGLMVGLVGLYHEYQVLIKIDPKILWSGVVWVGLISLILFRWRRSQGGRPFAWGIVGGFAFVMLTFWGTNLLSPIHNP